MIKFRLLRLLFGSFRGLARLYFRRLFRTLPFLSLMHVNIRMQLKITNTIFQGYHQVFSTSVSDE